jgi:hypothetical protein
VVSVLAEVSEELVVVLAVVEGEVVEVVEEHKDLSSLLNNSNNFPRNRKLHHRKRKELSSQLDKS